MQRTDGPTNGQTHDDSIYRASIASRGKSDAGVDGPFSRPVNTARDHAAINTQTPTNYYLIFTTRRYASDVCDVVVCLSVRPSVCPSVRPSHACIASKQLNVRSRKGGCTIAQGLLMSGANNLGEIPTTSPPLWRQIELE